MEFRDMMEVANRIDAEAVKLRDKLIEGVCDLPLNGHYINDGKDGGPVIAIIKFSELQRTKNWCPHFHLPPEQAKAIKEKYGHLETARGICSATREMLAKGYVVNGDTKTYLNDRTLKAIRESELGKYVINTNPIDNNSVI